MLDAEEALITWDENADDIDGIDDTTGVTSSAEAGNSSSACAMYGNISNAISSVHLIPNHEVPIPQYNLGVRKMGLF